MARNRNASRSVRLSPRLYRSTQQSYQIMPIPGGHEAYRISEPVGPGNVSLRRRRVDAESTEKNIYLPYYFCAFSVHAVLNSSQRYIKGSRRREGFSGEGSVPVTLGRTSS